jgi:hypothetical protein
MTATMILMMINVPMSDTGGGSEKQHNAGFKTLGN